LLAGYEHLSPRQRARFTAALAAEDPTNEIGAAHAVKERLRLLLGEHEPHLIRRRLYDFYDADARPDMQETTRFEGFYVPREDSTHARHLPAAPQQQRTYRPRQGWRSG